MFSISVQEEKGSIEDCHLTIVPVRAPNVNKPLVLPEQMIVPPVTRPGAVVGFTVTVTGDELAEAQVPLLTTARYCVVAVKLVAVIVVVVLVTSSRVDQSLVEYCHFSTRPTLPTRVNSVLLVTLQTVALPWTMPPKLTGSTVTVATEEFSEPHNPLFTTARYLVVAVKFVAVKVVVVFSTSTVVLQLSVEYCHLVTLPVLPFRFNMVLLVPSQTFVPTSLELPMLIVPPTLAGSTVTVAVAELVAGHVPLFTTAWYIVVANRLVAA